jgi:hypothetical protein
MTLLAPPDRTGDPLPSPQCEELEALIEEARARACKRRRRYGAAFAGAGLYAGFSGHTASQPQVARRPPATAELALTRACRTSQLQITTIYSYAGLGSSGAYISFTNQSRTPCELTGWPKLVAITSARHPFAAMHDPASSFEVTKTGIGIPVVKLAPGKRADAEFKTRDGAATRCPPSYRWLRITPPTNTKSVVVTAWIRYLGAYLPSCGGIGVSPVLPAADLMGG